MIDLLIAFMTAFTVVSAGLLYTARKILLELRVFRLSYTYVPAEDTLPTLARLEKIGVNITGYLERTDICTAVKDLQTSLESTSKTVQDANIEGLRKLGEQLLLEIRDSNERTGMFAQNLGGVLELDTNEKL